MSGRLVLVRHGQSYGNVDKRLDTRPPGAELTPLGRDQARDFAHGRQCRPALLGHSIATRARRRRAPGPTAPLWCCASTTNRGRWSRR